MTFALRHQSDRANAGRQGELGTEALATDGDYIYFAWEQDLGDIWLMDVVEDESD